MTRLSTLRVLADLGSAVLAVTLYLSLPFGVFGNAALSAVSFFAFGWVIDRRYLSHLSPEERAAELQARKDAEL